MTQVSLTGSGQKTPANGGVRASRAPVLGPRRRRGAVTKAQREEFLQALREAWSITAAAERAGRHRRRFYDLREADTGFADEWGDSWEQGTDLLEDELRRRVLDGVERPIYQGGQLVGVEHVKDTRALELALKARRPEVYRENAQASNGAVTIVIQSAFPGISPHADIELEATELPALPVGGEYEG